MCMRKAFPHLNLASIATNVMSLIGSYAKNQSREDSDIDVAIVVNHIEGDFFTTQPLIWKLRRQIDDRIEPILID